MKFGKRRPKIKVNKHAHLNDIKKIGGINVEHLSLKEKAKASKYQQKVDTSKRKLALEKNKAKSKMFKKYGSDNTNIKEFAARQKIETDNYAKRKFADASAHVLKVSPYVNSVNESVDKMFEEAN